MSLPRILLALLTLSCCAYGERFVLHPVADTALIEWLPTNNVGGGLRLLTGSQSLGLSRAIVRFDMTGIVTTSKVVYARANFRLFYPPSEEGRRLAGLELFRVLRSWDEGTGLGKLGSVTGDGASWQFAQDLSIPWQEPGGKFAVDWSYLESGFTTYAAMNQGEIVSFTPGISSIQPVPKALNQGVMDDVQSWVSTPSTNFGWLIYNPGTALEVASREDQQDQPELVIGTGDPEAPIVMINYEFVDAADTYIDAPASLQLETLFPNGRIFYSLDGSKPTLTSPRYTQAINLFGGEIIRAIAYNADYSAGGSENPAIHVHALPKFVLQFSQDDPGAGQVEISDMGAILWESSAPATFSIASNNVVTLQAIPSDGFRFANWSGEITGTEPIFTFNMTSPVSFKANFTHVLPSGLALSARRVDNNFLVLQFPATNSVVYVVQSSIDLTNWSGYQTHSNQVSTVDTIIPFPSTSDRSFYRLFAYPASGPAPPY